MENANFSSLTSFYKEHPKRIVVAGLSPIVIRVLVVVLSQTLILPLKKRALRVHVCAKKFHVSDRGTAYALNTKNLDPLK